MTPTHKKILKTTAIIFGILLALWTLHAAYYGWQASEWYRKTDLLTAMFEAPYRKDTYGGKTPEETWAMYVDAVKKRDIELASKYYYVDQQHKKLDILTKELKRDNLDLYLYQLNNPLQKATDVPDYLASDKDRAYYFYQWKDSETGQIVKYDVNMYLNPYTNVWKLMY